MKFNLVTQLGLNVTELLGAVVDALMNFFAPIFYGIQIGLFFIINTIQDAVKGLVGLGPHYWVDRTSKEVTGPFNTDPAMTFLQVEVVQSTFLSVLIAAVFLLIIATFVGVIKTEFNEKGDNSKTPVIESAIKGLAYFFIVPITCYIGIFVANVVLKMLDSATSRGADHFSKQIFAAASARCNRVREYSLEDASTKRAVIAAWALYNRMHNGAEGLTQIDTYDKKFTETIKQIYFNSFKNNIFITNFAPNSISSECYMYIPKSVFADDIPNDKARIKSVEDLFFNQIELEYNSTNKTINGVNVADIIEEVSDFIVGESFEKNIQTWLDAINGVRFNVNGNTNPPIQFVAQGKPDWMDSERYFLFKNEHGFEPLKTAITNIAGNTTYEKEATNFDTSKYYMFYLYNGEYSNIIKTMGVAEESAYLFFEKNIVWEQNPEQLNKLLLAAGSVGDAHFNGSVTFNTSSDESSEASGGIWGVFGIFWNLIMHNANPMNWLSFDTYDNFLGIEVNKFTVTLDGADRAKLADFIDDQFRLDGNQLDITNYQWVSYFYDLRHYNYLIGWLGAWLIVQMLLNLMIGCIQRIFEIAVLFVASPGFIALMPLDQGERYKEWKKQFIQRVFMAYGPILGMNLAFMVLNMINATDREFLLWDPDKQFADIGNGIVSIIIMFTALVCIKSITKMITELIGQGDALKAGEETGKAMKELALKTAGVASTAAMMAPNLARGAVSVARQHGAAKANFNDHTFFDRNGNAITEEEYNAGIADGTLNAADWQTGRQMYQGASADVRRQMRNSAAAIGVDTRRRRMLDYGTNAAGVHVSGLSSIRQSIYSDEKLGKAIDVIGKDNPLGSLLNSPLANKARAKEEAKARRDEEIREQVRARNGNGGGPGGGGGPVPQGGAGGNGTANAGAQAAAAIRSRARNQAYQQAMQNVNLSNLTVTGEGIAQARAALGRSIGAQADAWRAQNGGQLTAAQQHKLRAATDQFRHMDAQAIARALKEVERGRNAIDATYSDSAGRNSQRVQNVRVMGGGLKADLDFGLTRGRMSQTESGIRRLLRSAAEENERAQQTIRGRRARDAAAQEGYRNNNNNNGNRQ